MWVQSVYICCKGIGKKEKYKELLKGFEPNYFTPVYASGNALVLENYENIRIDYDCAIKEFSKNHPNDMLCVNDRYTHFEDKVHNSKINQDRFEYYKAGKKIAHSIYKYKKAGKNDFVSVPLDDGGYDYMELYYKKPNAKFYVDDKLVDEKKFLSVFSSGERKIFDEVLGVLNSKSYELGTLNTYLNVDKTCQEEIKSLENKILKTSGDIVSELNKASKSKTKDKVPVVYDTDGKTAKIISKELRKNIFESLEEVFGDFYPNGDLDDIYYDNYYDMVDADVDVSPEEVDECKLFMRCLLHFFFKMVEVNLDFKHYKEMIEALISYTKSHGKNDLILEHLEMVKDGMKELPKEIIKEYKLDKIVKKISFDKLIKMLRNVEKYYSYYKPHFVGSIDRKDLKNLDVEYIAFSANEDGKESGFDDVYVCIKNSDRSAVKKYIKKSVAEVEYMGSKDKYISIYTMEYKKSELSDYIYE
ncbi:MAG: hypothetical protein IKI71_03860 [Lachnospiraceae bacterium]|nr:hypothetical protein [Lachnospiraceae bacterium]